MLLYARLSEGDELPALDISAPFKCVILSELNTSGAFQMAVCSWLIDFGCRYTLAWGIDAEVWHDAADQAAADVTSKHVMTTWHDEEAVRDVLEFAVHNATETPDGQPIHSTLIIHISAHDAEAELRRLHEDVLS